MEWAGHGSGAAGRTRRGVKRPGYGAAPDESGLGVSGQR